MSIAKYGAEIAFTSFDAPQLALSFHNIPETPSRSSAYSGLQ